MVRWVQAANEPPSWPEIHRRLRGRAAFAGQRATTLGTGSAGGGTEKAAGEAIAITQPSYRRVALPSRQSVENAPGADLGSKLMELAFLPGFELPEQLALLLRIQRHAAQGLLPLVDKAREDCPEVLQVGGGSDLRIVL